jgi:hypothetical protein
LNPFWLSNHSFQENFESWWNSTTINSGSPMYCLQQCLKNLKQQIRKWNKEEFGNIFSSKSKLTEKMKQIQQEMITKGRT